MVKKAEILHKVQTEQCKDSVIHVLLCHSSDAADYVPCKRAVNYVFIGLIDVTQVL